MGEIEDSSGTDAEELNTWLWCSRCCRCYQGKHIKLMPHPLADHLILQVCYYYPDCHAETQLHAWNWSAVRTQHPEYPPEPELNVVYAAHLQ